MGETITITLKKPIKGPNNLEVKAVIIREPMFDDVIELGDPYMIAVTASKVPFQVENSEVIRAYLERCIVEPKDPALLAQVNGRTAIEIKDRFLNFFQPDAPANAE
jgi:hypothetical protein